MEEKSKINPKLEELLSNLSPKEQEILQRQMSGTKPMDRTTFKHYHKPRRCKIGIISDTHIGSKFFDYETFEKSIKTFDREKVEAIYHAGDVIEGMSNRDGHIYELETIGTSAQINQCVDLLNQYKQPLFFIIGNHMEWAKNKANQGIELGPMLESKLKNGKYIGDYEADINLAPDVNMRLTHDGNSAYALCFDDITEVLTENGWKLFKDLDKTEKVFTFNIDTGKTELQFPEDYFEYDYEGDMLLYETKQFNFCVTPNHRMMVKRGWSNLVQSNKWKFIEMKDIKPRQYVMKKDLGNWEGKHLEFIKIPKPEVKKKGKLQTYKELFNVKDWFEFMGWFLSEGNLNHSNKQVELSQCPNTNPIKYKEIVDLCKRMGYNPYVYGSKIRIASLQLYQYLKQFGLCYQKFVPNYIMNATKELIEIFLLALYKGDGCFKNGKLCNYTTNSKQLADDVQILNLKCGRTCTIKKYDDRKSNFNQTKPIYQLSVGYVHNECEYGRDKNDNFIEIPYNGKIYCIQTPNRTLFTRRYGKTLWTGNSYSSQKRINALSDDGKPNILVNGHLHKAIYMYYRDIHSIEASTMQRQTPFMARKGSPAHVGFWIFDIQYNKKGISGFKPMFYPKDL